LTIELLLTILVATSADKDLFLGCLEDEDVIAECFASCLNNCNYKGICKNGECDCASGYTGDDCSSKLTSYFNLQK
jgi:hypothetical protein